MRRVAQTTPHPLNEVLVFSSARQTPLLRNYKGLINQNAASTTTYVPSSFVLSSTRTSQSESSFDVSAISSLKLPLKFSAIQRIKDGTIRVHAGIWPTFVYEEGLYDADDIEKGLLRGWLLVRVSVPFTYQISITTTKF